MKKNIVLLLLITTSSIMLSSCATKIPFELTCLNCVQSQRINCKGDNCPQTVMIGNDCIVSIDETGEKINMNRILMQEKIPLAGGIPLTLAKIRGRYFVTGAGFDNLWVLTPHNNQAKIGSIAFPYGKNDAAPIFEISGNRLLVKDFNKKFALEYDIDSKRWIPQTIKTGA